MIDMQLQGFDELQQNLRRFTTEVQQNGLENSLVAGAKEVQTEIKAQAPRDHSIDRRKKAHIADNIVIKREKNPIGSAAEVYVGPGKSVSSKARWMELGVTAHAIVNKLSKQMMKDGEPRKGVLASSTQVFGTHVEHPGLSPRPFMRPALSASAPKAIEAMKVYLASFIKKTTAKMSKQFAPARAPKN